MSEPLAAWAAAARPDRRVGRAIDAHRSLGSTNDRARELLTRDGGEGIAVVAEEQVAGRGRRGRTWSSPPGRNLMVSIGLRPRLAAASAWQLGLAVALAARRACRTVAPVGLKWPNDLVAPDGRKVGGLLVETAVEADRIAAAVIGIGINVNWRRAEMEPSLAETATSLAELAGGEVDRVVLLGRLLDALDDEVTAAEGGRSPLPAYRDACVTLGELVAVETGEARVTGRAVGLDHAGGLVVETAAGERLTLTSGEVVRLRPAVPA